MNDGQFFSEDTNIIVIEWRWLGRFNFLFSLNLEPAYITQGLTVALADLSLAAPMGGSPPARVERSHNLYGIVITTGDIAYEHSFACCNE
jgi:hypothetical protein